jgi:hypothetical protein
MSLRLRLSMLALGLVVAAAVAACSGSATPPPSQDAAEAAVCASLATFKTSVEGLTTLDPKTATKEDVESQRTEIRAAWDDVQLNMTTLKEADKAALTTAWTSLGAALEAIPSDTPVADYLPALQTAASGVKGTYAEIYDGISCT